jgi:3-isopropylmalate/(R)-2-methylmalate dehydratase large subunit
MNTLKYKGFREEISIYRENSPSEVITMVQTIAEKILASHSSRETVHPGEFVQANIDIAMGHIALARVAANFLGFPREIRKIWDPNKVVALEDHYAPPPSERWAMVQKLIRDFAKEQNIKNFYDIKAGICHQVLPEKGHVLPGTIVVGTDSHTTTYGAYNAAGTGIGYTEMTWVFIKGNLWFRVPETLKFDINGKLQKGVMSKDVLLSIAGTYRADVAQYKSVEFSGKTVENMSLASRTVLSNMGLEIGAKFAFTTPDRKILDFLKGRTKEKVELVKADEDAKYEKVYEMDVTNLEPQVACPHTVDNVKPISQVEGTPVHQAFLGSCTNGRLEDMRIAAEILKGQKVHRDCRMIVIPASWEVYKDAMNKGYIETLIDAEAIICNSNCGPCFGSHMGMLCGGEKCISSSNRNFRGRMGSENAEVYLASPATVAASALNAKITDPRKVM